MFFLMSFSVYYSYPDAQTTQIVFFLYTLTVAVAQPSSDVYAM